jgi:hypothetical protein
LRAEVDAACERAGREPGDIVRSACVLVEMGERAHERPHDVPAVAASRLASHLRQLAQAGAGEAILVVDPITERSTRELAAVIVDLK